MWRAVRPATHRLPPPLPPPTHKHNHHLDFHPEPYQRSPVHPPPAVLLKLSRVLFPSPRLALLRPRSGGANGSKIIDNFGVSGFVLCSEHVRPGKGGGRGALTGERVRSFPVFSASAGVFVSHHDEHSSEARGEGGGGE